MKEGRPTHNDDMVMFGMLVAKHGIETAAGTMVLVTATRVSKRMKVHEVAESNEPSSYHCLFGSGVAKPM